MKKLFFTLFWCVFYFIATAQTDIGLVAYYNFNTNLNDITGNTSNAGLPVDQPVFACGVEGNALSFNGGSDEVRFVGSVKEEFNSTEDFTLSLYFKSTSNTGTQYLISKRRMSCELDNAFFVRYQPGTSTINVYVGERDGRIANIVAQLSQNVCWHHLVVIRRGGTVTVFADGAYLLEQTTVGRVDLLNEVDLILGSSECFGPNEAPFNGLIDEMRVYNRALNRDEVATLFLKPDQLVTQDTVIFLGNFVDVEFGQSCATDFRWSPSLYINPPFGPSPRIQPFQAGEFRYAVRVSGPESSCVAIDSLKVTVVDPNDLDCNTVFLPKAFTPNGDGLNETYGISNPFAIQLLSFEIFDRWGSRIFATVNPFDRWDGIYKGQPVSPGVMQYKVRFFCDGEEKESSGTFMIMH